MAYPSRIRSSVETWRLLGEWVDSEESKGVSHAETLKKKALAVESLRQDSLGIRIPDSKPLPKVATAVPKVATAVPKASVPKTVQHKPSQLALYMATKKTLPPIKKPVYEADSEANSEEDLEYEQYLHMEDEY